jgi:hypothetical protein
MKPSRMLLIVLVLATSGTLLANDNTRIQIGSVSVRLGENEHDVRSKLLEVYDVSKEGLVRSKDFVQYFGTVAFTNGKLTAAVCDWAPQDSAMHYDYSKAFYALMDHMVREGRTKCEISVGESHRPNGEAHTAFIVCGAKRIEVTYVDIDGNRDALLTEQIGRLPSEK